MFDGNVGGSWWWSLFCGVKNRSGSSWKTRTGFRAETSSEQRIGRKFNIPFYSFGCWGTESCDWAAILFRMYTRYMEKHGYKVEVLDMNEGEEAGIKSVTMLIQGELPMVIWKRNLVFTTGFLSRWFQCSTPYQFASVLHGLKWMTTLKSSSPWGYQSGNLPSQWCRRTARQSERTLPYVCTIYLQVLVSCRVERSQIQNRERAMKMLKAQLYEREVEAKK